MLTAFPFLTEDVGVLSLCICSSSRHMYEGCDDCAQRVATAIRKFWDPL